MEQSVADGRALFSGQLTGHDEVVHVDIRKVARMLEGATATDGWSVAGK